MSEFDSSFDTLTGLYNRAAFDKAAKLIAERKAFSVIICIALRRFIKPTLSKIRLFNNILRIYPFGVKSGEAEWGCENRLNVGKFRVATLFK